MHLLVLHFYSISFLKVSNSFHVRIGQLMPAVHEMMRTQKKFQVKKKHSTYMIKL
jgi:hypothetical protein